ncbi:MAG: hypothetical protein K6G30_10110 [Acetatifactor sp.]|nr:hypothetical protein [Acetatifactor sp.]
MAAVDEMTFRRRFSVNPYKQMRLPLGEMSCFKDWISDDRGEPYPVVLSNEQESALEESLPDARYRVENHTTETLYKARLLGQHFPYATYDIEVDELEMTGEESGIGICFHSECLPDLMITVGKRQDKLGVTCKINETVQSVETDIIFCKKTHLIVTCHGKQFDVYLKAGDKPEYVGMFTIPEYETILSYEVFNRTTASLFVYLRPEESVQCAACFYLEGGISHADIKSMRYENGQPIMENGRIFLTFTARLQEGGFQSVVSWNPSTDDFRMEGAIFFDLGDGNWCADIASSVVYDRRCDAWYVWACSFSHGHVLCHGKSYADLRYGINVIDAELMEENPGAPDDTLFYAKFGDEDPDLTYDAKREKWLLAICRLTKCDEGGEKYRYFLFESENPFEGYVHVDHTTSGENTGGSIIRIGEKMYFLCGSDFDKRAQYRLHSIEDLSEYTLLKFDYDDGGFRGWGTLLPIPCGSRIRYMLITFDRHNGSTYNWSYGNIYVYEADKYEKR